MNKGMKSRSKEEKDLLHATLVRVHSSVAKKSPFGMAWGGVLSGKDSPVSEEEPYH